MVNTMGLSTKQFYELLMLLVLIVVIGILVVDTLRPYEAYIRLVVLILGYGFILIYLFVRSNKLEQTN